jgi:hypothetical protein
MLEFFRPTQPHTYGGHDSDAAAAGLAQTGSDLSSPFPAVTVDQEQAERQPDSITTCCHCTSVSAVTSDLDFIRTQFLEHERRLIGLERDLTGGEQSLKHLQAGFRRLESRIDALLAARTRERPDVATTVHSAHRAIADEFRPFVEQRLQAVARELAAQPEWEASYQRREIVPRLIAILSKHLFSDRAITYTSHVMEELYISDRTVAHDLFTVTRDKARDLRRRSREAGLAARWDFNLGSANVDPNRQDAWLGCDGSGEVLFVVSPSYLVDGQLYAKQLVFTSTEP